jgi:RES domain-containing protein
MEVPSAIVEVECNLLLNPRHQYFAEPVIGCPKPVAFDSRMWKS